MHRSIARLPFAFALFGLFLAPGAARAGTFVDVRIGGGLVGTVIVGDDGFGNSLFDGKVNTIGSSTRGGGSLFDGKVNGTSFGRPTLGGGAFLGSSGNAFLGGGGKATGSSAHPSGFQAGAPGPSAFLNPSPAPAGSRRIFALTEDGLLLRLRSDRANKAAVVDRIGPLQGDSALVGIDFRPADGELYGLGNAGGIYRIDTRTARATRVSGLAVPLVGGRFGIDFDPVSDRLRVVSDAGRNLRVNVDTGETFVDADLNFPDLVPPGPVGGVSAIAYTNADTDPATGTVLYAIDGIADALLLVAPPNAGSLGFVGLLGIDVGSAVGFDIGSESSDASSRAARAFVTVDEGDGRTALFRIDLVSGSAKRASRFRSDFDVIDIAVRPAGH